MKVNTQKSSLTLPSHELAIVVHLKKNLMLKSNTDVIRLALQELQKKVERKKIREQFTKASKMVSLANKNDLKDLDFLAGEGLDE